MIAKTIVKGTRVHTGLYNRGYGTVMAVHGKQAPETSGTIGGVIACGGRATFDIVFDRGALSMGLPECILRGVQWEIIAEVVVEDTIDAAISYAAAEQRRAH